MDVTTGKIAVGLSTYVGLILTVITGAVPFIAELSDATAPLGVDPALWLKVSATLGAVTVFGRMLQAAFAAFKVPPVQ